MLSAHISAHMDKDRFFMEEFLQGFHVLVRHPQPFLFREIDNFLFYSFLFALQVSLFLLLTYPTRCFSWINCQIFQARQGFEYPADRVPYNHRRPHKPRQFFRGHRIQRKAQREGRSKLLASLYMAISLGILSSCGQASRQYSQAVHGTKYHVESTTCCKKLFSFRWWGPDCEKSSIFSSNCSRRGHPT